MKENLFRKESIESLRTPENLDDYLQVTKVSVWIILIAIFLLVVGFIVWGFTAQIGNGISFINLVW
jgi:hypothetical protein